MKKLLVKCQLGTLLLSLFITFNAYATALSKSQLELEQAVKTHQGKVIYLDFWASWCGPCRKSFPWMNELTQKHDVDKFVVLSVNLDANKALADKFLLETPAKFSVIYDPKGKIARHFKIKGMPSSIVFDKQGKIRYTHTGFHTKKIVEYEKQIAQLMSEE